MSLAEVNDTPARSEFAPGKLAAALAKAQAKISNPAKNAINPHFKSNYADLSAGIDAIRLALAEQEICFTQTTTIQGDLVVLYTRLIHSSGEWIGSEWPVAIFGKTTPQQMGSALTYARRYSLFPIVGIAGEDDDGNAASQRQPETQSPRRSEAAQLYYDESVKRIEAETSAKVIKTWWHSEAAKKERDDMLDRDTHAALLAKTKKRIAELEKNATAQ